MATCQYCLWLVPAEVLKAENLGGSLDDDTLAGVWARADDRHDIVDHVGSILPAGPAMGSSFHFGDDSSHDALVDLKDGRVAEVSFRLDVRKQWRPVLGRFCELAKKLECCFVDAQGRVLPPTMAILEQEVMRSRAVEFVRDPIAFLRRVDRDRLRGAGPG